MLSAAQRRVSRILGIDPGSRITGWGVIDVQGSTLRYVASGCVRTRDSDMTGRLKEIFLAVSSLVEEHQPDELAVEQVFMHRNADSALKLGHARAAAICASFSGEASVHEYAPRAIKLAVVGRGGAEKSQVAHMVGILLGLSGRQLAADEADALAVALCHAHTRPLAARLAVTDLRAGQR